jgi:hypothetical protein
MPRSRAQGRRRRGAFAVIAAISLLGFGVNAPLIWPVNAYADEPEPFDSEQDFHIAAEPLDQALAAYAKASGVDILYDQAVTEKLTSKPLLGRYTEAAALRTMLQGTGLTSRFTGRKAALVFRQGEPPPPSPSERAALPTVRLDLAQVRPPVMIGEDASAFEAYAAGAEAQIRDFLSRDPAVNGATFRVILAVQVAESGLIERASLAQGSSNGGRDDHIRRVLAGQALPKPPPGLPHILTFEIDWVPVNGG